MHISIIVSGLSDATERLQPWRYISELAAGLVQRGHAVELISETTTTLPGVSGTPRRLGLGSLNPARGLTGHLRATRPDLVMWNTGATSAIRLRPRRVVDACHVAIFTSPLYRPPELLRVGVDLARHPLAYGVLGLGSLLPRRGVAHYLATEFAHVIAPGSTTVRRLVASGLEPDRITALPPGREMDIRARPVAPRAQTDITTFVYAGSPLAIRGPDLLIRAFARAYPDIGNARLLILSRHERAELAQHTERLVTLAARLHVESCVEIVSGTLPRVEFLKQLARADAFVLPFRLVPSEAPIAVLEAAGAGRPLIASALPAVTDLAAPGSLLTRPGDIGSLARALTSIAADPARAQQLGIDASGWYARWPTWCAVVEQLDGILTSLTRTAGSGARGLQSPAVRQEPKSVQ